MTVTGNSNLKQIFESRLFLLVGLLGTLVYQFNSDLTLLNSTPTQVPFFLKYLILLVFIGLIFSSFDDTYGYYSRRNTIHQIISVVLVLAACVFISYFFDKQDLINAINKSYLSPFNFKTPKGIETNKDLLNTIVWLPLTILLWTTFLVSSILLLLNLAGFFGNSKGEFDVERVLSVSSIVIGIISIGILIHYFIQRSFNENFKSYLSENLNSWQLETLFFTLITIVLLIINALNVKSSLNDQIKEFENTKEILENQYLKKANHDKKFVRVSSFDLYGLAVTRMDKTIDGFNYKCYGFINRLGDIILDNNFQLHKYYDDYRPYTYYKHYQLIIVSEIGKSNMGVIDIYGNWIIPLRCCQIEYPINQNPSGDYSTTQYVNIDNESLIDLNMAVLVLIEEEIDYKENNKGTEWWSYTRENKAFYLDNNFNLIPMKYIYNYVST